MFPIKQIDLMHLIKQLVIIFSQVNKPTTITKPILNLILI